MPLNRLAVALLALAACSGGAEPTAARVVPTSKPATAAVVEPAVAVVAARPVEPERVPVALVTDAAALAEVAQSGGAFGQLVPPDSYAVLAKTIEADVAVARRADPAAGVGVAGNAHRLFDRRWLATGRYDLVGLAYRLDRLPVTAGRCGDVHLIYRLAYTKTQGGEEVSSRLPMTVAVLLERAPSSGLGCREAAASWMAPPGVAGGALGRWLMDGALAGALAPARVTEVRVNVQLVRWPSAVRPDLGGHAEYLLRSFKPTGPARALERAGLENTPDLARLLRDRAARERLVAWVRDPANWDAIEAGTALLPEEFLAQRAISVSPRGLSRRANRPFRQLLRASDLDAAALAGRALIGSPEALIRRLDDMSCQGCHQSRTIAGFHLLGEDGVDAAAGNALAVSISAPLHAERGRREALVAEIAAGRPADMTRPFAERPAGDEGHSGSRCGLTGDPGFAAWTCAPGLTCTAVDAPADDALVGVCLPERGAVGDPCEIGAIAPHADAHRDRVRRTAERACEVGVCNTNRVGFPGGMCTTGCGDLPDDGACGVIALLTPFNNCLARGTPFPRCLAEHVAPAGLRRCGADEPCREDYICARTPGGEGACIPPYFLFQLRVDGHP